MIFPSILSIEVSARDKQILFVHTVLRGIGAFDQMKMEVFTISFLFVVGTVILLLLFF